MTIPRNLSKLAEGADSNGVLGTSNGGTGLSSLGTPGQVVSVNSGGTGLQYSTPSAGAMTLISTLTATGSNITWTNLSGYDKYTIIFENLNTSYAGQDPLFLQVGTGSSPTWVSSGYDYRLLCNNSSSTVVNGTNLGYFIIASNPGEDGVLGYGASGSILITNFTNNTSVPTCFLLNEHHYGNTLFCSLVGGGGVISGSANTAITLQGTFGTISSGKASLYGISS